MKIAQVTNLYESVPPHHQHGLEFIVSWLTEELVRRGHDVTLFGSGDSTTKARLVSLFDISSRDGGKGDSFDMDPLMRAVWNGSAVATMHKEFDVIHDHSWLMPIFGTLVSTPIVSTLHEPYREASQKGFFNHPTRAHIMGEARSQIEYVTVSQRQEELFSRHAAPFFKKHRTIHNGIPVEQFPFSTTSEKYLLYIGYINEEKGADIAVRVATALDMPLILAGRYTGCEQFFEEKVRPYLNDKIVYRGSVGFEEKVALYKNARAFLAPLRWEEPFGLVLTEAQACGTPVVALARGAAPEIVAHGTTGFVVETEEDMLEAVKKISTISRRACRDRVEKHFTVQNMTDQYEALYQELV